MNDFTASNGVRIRVDLEGDYRFGGTARSADYVVRRGGANEQALREFFQAEADERLGRFRHGQFLVYPDDEPGYVMVIDETTPDEPWRFARDSVSFAGEPGEAARAYFDAHPEPKPWHDAKPGEVWDVDMPDGGMRAVTFYAAGRDEPQVVFRDAFTQEVVTVDSEDIRDARRVFPEVS